MQIESQPNQFSSAFGAVSYGIAAGSETAATVHIVGGNPQRVLGAKRISGATQYAVNIAPYLRGEFDPRPLPAGGVGFVAPQGRLTLSHIVAGGRLAADGSSVAGGIASQQTFITGAVAELSVGAHKLLSARPSSLSIRPGDADEIAFIALAGTPCKARFELFTREGDTCVSFEETFAPSITSVVALNVSMPGIAVCLEHLDRDLDDMGFFDLEVVCGATVVHSCRYRIDRDNADGVRLAWVNAHGAIDHFTFRAPASAVDAVKKDRIYGPDGVSVVSGVTETVRTLRPGHQCAAVMRWLASLVASPRVWMVTPDGLLPVDILTAEWPSEGGDPASAQIAFRPAGSPPANV